MLLGLALQPKTDKFVKLIKVSYFICTMKINMDENDGSLMVQLRDFEDVDNGIVLIKLYFFPSSHLCYNPVFLRYRPLIASPLLLLSPSPCLKCPFLLPSPASHPPHTFKSFLSCLGACRTMLIPALFSESKKHPDTLSPSVVIFHSPSVRFTRARQRRFIHTNDLCVCLCECVRLF